MSTALSKMSYPPGPSGHWLLGNLMDFHHSPLEFMESNARKYGDISHFRFLHMHAYQVHHPDDVRTVLVDPDGAFVKGMALEGFRPLVGKGLLLNEGESHRRQRRMMQPAFHRQKIGRYCDQMVQEAARIRSSWKDNQAVDMAEEMNRLTLHVATETLFGADLSPAEVEDVGAAIRAFARWYHQTSHPLGPLLQLLPTQTNRRFRRGRRRLVEVVRRLIARRRQEGDRGDILSMLVEARDAEGDGGQMSETHLEDEAVGLLVAGHETTGGTLGWAWWLLSQHPEVLQRLQEEVDSALGDRLPTLDDVPRLKYAEWVFAEALRLYPSAMALARQAVKPVVLGGYTLQPGSLVMTAAWCTHHDPRWFDDPMAFRPERWAPERKAERPRFSYYPFSGGSRVCIGEAFAWLEGTLVLATLAQAFSAVSTPGHQVVPETLFTLRPRGGLPMVLRARHQRAAA